MNYAIGFISKDTGAVRYYTGKAGEGWLSPNRSDAFFGYSLDGVIRMGNRMLNTPVLHGRYDVLAVEELDQEPTFESEGGLTD